MSDTCKSDFEVLQELQGAVNKIGGALDRIRKLEGALSAARLTINTLKEGLSPASCYVPYHGAAPKKFLAIADEGISAASTVLGK